VQAQEARARGASSTREAKAARKEAKAQEVIRKKAEDELRQHTWVAGRAGMLAALDLLLAVLHAPSCWRGKRPPTAP
jgi:hypothetical protein